MFPTQKVSYTSANNSADTTNNIGSTFYFDFDKGDFVIKNGQATRIDEIESLKMWIKKLLRTESNRYDIYDTYGVSLKDIVMSENSFGYIQSELERTITTALLTHSAILNVYNFEFTRERRTLIIKFHIDTIYGATSEVITI